MAGDDRAWGALLVSVPQAHEDEFCGLLGCFSLGVAVGEARGGISQLKVFLASPDQATAARDYARGVLRSLGLDPDSAGMQVESIADGHWVERYQAQLRPMDLGTRFRVFPSGRIEATDGRTPLRLVPGRAFGTGEHPTTRLCAEALEPRVVPGSRWLDLGCGTAILSMVCRQLGAERVDAVDIDAEAIRVAEEVLRDNAITSGIQLLVGGIDNLEARTWDGIVSNIQAPFFLDSAPRLARALEPGAPIIVSGILEEDLPAIEAAWVAAGLHPELRSVRAPWALSIATRPA